MNVTEYIAQFQEIPGNWEVWSTRSDSVLVTEANGPRYCYVFADGRPPRFLRDRLWEERQARRQAQRDSPQSLETAIESAEQEHRATIDKVVERARPENKRRTDAAFSKTRAEIAQRAARDKARAEAARDKDQERSTHD